MKTCAKYRTKLLISVSVLALILVAPPVGAVPFTTITDAPAWMPPIVTDTAIFESFDFTNLSGSNSNANTFMYRVGTDANSNPAIGLEFNGSETVDYSYSANFRNRFLGPTKIASGTDSFKITPYLEMPGTPTFTAQTRQNPGPLPGLLYGTDFTFALYVDMGILGTININETLAIPNFDLGGALQFNTNGAGNINTTGSVLTDLSNSSGPGSFTYATQPVEISAWSVEADLIAALAAVNIPGVSTAMSFADLLGFDLNVELGMGIKRKDVFALASYSFAGADSFGMLSVPVVEGGISYANYSVEGGISNGSYSYTVDTNLNYQLTLLSSYDYPIAFGMTFDGPFFDEQTLFSTPLGDVHVADIVTTVTGTIPVSISGAADVCTGLEATNYVPCNLFNNRGALFRYQPVEIPDSLPLAYTPFSVPLRSLGQIEFMTQADTQFIDLVRSVRSAPEPSTLALAALGLAGLGWGRRKSIQA